MEVYSFWSQTAMGRFNPNEFGGLLSIIKNNGILQMLEVLSDKTALLTTKLTVCVVNENGRITSQQQMNCWVNNNVLTVNNLGIPLRPGDGILVKSSTGIAAGDTAEYEKVCCKTDKTEIGDNLLECHYTQHPIMKLYIYIPKQRTVIL